MLLILRKSNKTEILKILIMPDGLSFEIKRLQFPIQHAFAMTINKFIGNFRNQLRVSMFFTRQTLCSLFFFGKPSALFIYAQNSKRKTVYHGAL